MGEIRTMTAITGSEIDLFRMSVLEKALKLELLGMKGRGRSAYAIIKSEFSIKGNRQSVYNQFVAHRQLKIAEEKATRITL
jgi:hypothetical protein